MMIIMVEEFPCIKYIYSTFSHVHGSGGVELAFLHHIYTQHIREERELA